MSKVSRNIDQPILPGQERPDAYLRALRACQELIFMSFTLIDQGRASEARGLFIEGGIHTLNGEVFQGSALTEFFRAREAMVERRTRHCVANISFNLISEQSAEARYTSVVYVLPQQNPGAVVDIQDTFVKQDHSQRWLFARRDVVVVAGSR